MACLVGGNALGCIIPDIVVIEGVIIVVEAGRSEEFWHRYRVSLGIGHNHPTGQIDPGISANVAKPSHASFLIPYEGTQILAGWGVGFIQLPVQPRLKTITLTTIVNAKNLFISFHHFLQIKNKPNTINARP